MSSKVYGMNLIKEHEGLRLKPYKCPAGKLTIGYGRNLEDNGITEKEAKLMLISDLDFLIEKLENKTTWFKELDYVRQAVILDMAYNLGFNGLLKFKRMIQALKNRNFLLASNEMMDSKWAKQVGKRAINLQVIMINGIIE